MKTLQAILSASLIGYTYGGALSEAAVYTFGPISESKVLDGSIPSVAPPAARVLFAQRLGLSEYHNLGDAGYEALDLLNRNGGSQRPLFRGSEKDEQVHRLLVVIEGAEDPSLLFEDDHEPAFTITHPPLASSNLQLASDFLLQDRHRRSAADSMCKDTLDMQSASIRGGISCDLHQGTYLLRNPLDSTGSKIDASRELDLLEASRWRRTAGAEFKDSTMIFYVSILEEVAQVHGSQSGVYNEAVLKLRKSLSALMHQTDNQESTIMITPPFSNYTKRTENPYGAYTVPGGHATFSSREQQMEEPLYTPHPVVSPPMSFVQTQKLGSPSGRPKTTMPICHTTEALCMNVTLACSGHGSCYRKFTDRSKNDTAGIDCWACGCTSTVRTNKDGSIKTTSWGGPACQKKDISAPFFLIAGFTVAIVTVVAWGIGLMYSIGQEELPSVIGAGVTGPRATK